MIIKDIENLVEQNNNFRKVLHTGAYCQLVTMSISVNDDIGPEVHPHTDQILLIIDGSAEVEIGDESRTAEDEDLIFIPAGTKHNVTNIGAEDLKLLSIYAPSEHPDGTLHKTKEEAISSELKDEPTGTSNGGSEKPVKGGE